MQPRLILDSGKFLLTLDRLCYELIENHATFSETVLIGIQPRGVPFADRIYQRLSEILKKKDIQYGKLDVTFYRDDFRRRENILAAKQTDIEFVVEKKRVVLIDDVLFTGRTIRAAMDALMDFGRPSAVELLTLIDRRFSRHVPVQPNYVGKTIDVVDSEKVKVEWAQIDGADKIWILEDNKK